MRRPKAVLEAGAAQGPQRDTWQVARFPRRGARTVDQGTGHNNAPAAAAAFGHSTAELLVANRGLVVVVVVVGDVEVGRHSFDRRVYSTPQPLPVQEQVAPG